MKKSTLAGFSLGVVTLAVFIATLAISNNAPPVEWVSDAFVGIAFSFAFGLGAPEALAKLLAAATFGVIFSIGFFVGKFLMKSADKPKKANE